MELIVFPKNCTSYIDFCANGNRNIYFYVHRTPEHITARYYIHLVGKRVRKKSQFHPPNIFSNLFSRTPRSCTYFITIYHISIFSRAHIPHPVNKTKKYRTRKKRCSSTGSHTHNIVRYSSSKLSSLSTNEPGPTTRAPGNFSRSIGPKKRGPPNASQPANNPRAALSRGQININRSEDVN